MAEASSGLDINLEASGKINSVMFISIFEVSENWKGKNWKRWVVGRILQKHNGYERRVAFVSKEEKLILLLHPDY